MPVPAFIFSDSPNALVVSTLCQSSWLLLATLIPQLSRRLLDLPNLRSSHSKPISRASGIAFVTYQLLPPPLLY